MKIVAIQPVKGRMNRATKTATHSIENIYKFTIRKNGSPVEKIGETFPQLAAGLFSPLLLDSETIINLTLAEFILQAIIQ